ncbi:polyphenol oxidase family protein [Treponema primitia]|uniref:polyphenol oxidase family protein n=1 Tax=Treponema primitia TaxID=88058 RepID=UPI00397ED263
MPMTLHPFTLSFDSPSYAQMPLMMDGGVVREIRCVISSRAAGNMVYSDDSDTRTPFFRSLGLAPEQVRSCTQVHSRTVLAADDRFSGRPEADGMVSRDRTIALAVTVADCLPVFLYDTLTGAWALLHSGWKGTGIVLNALSLMADRWGTRPEAVAALLGPCIHPCCYQVDEERAAVFEAEFGGPSGAYPLGPVVKRDGGKPALDLQAANARLLAKAGVRNIAYGEDCTFTDQRLGSFRRERPAYTRMLAVMGYF